MANLKNITDLPVAESAEGLNLIVNDNGAAKQIAAGAVGAQADFAVTDENSPAFIKNKPDYDAVITLDGGNEIATLTSGTYDALKTKIVAGEMPKILVKGEWTYGDDYNVTANVVSAYFNKTSSIIELEVRMLWYFWWVNIDSTGTIVDFGS